MKVTAPGLIRSTGVAAIAAGLLFVVIQPIHPPDTLASVTTGAWSAIHQATLLMTVLFLAGITGSTPGRSRNPAGSASQATSP